jgi:hypothetical protein
MNELPYLLPWGSGMDRRRFLLTSLARGLAAPLQGETQQATKVPRIAYLMTSPLESPEGRASVAAFQQGLTSPPAAPLYVCAGVL